MRTLVRAPQDAAGAPQGELLGSGSANEHDIATRCLCDKRGQSTALFPCKASCGCTAGALGKCSHVYTQCEWKCVGGGREARVLVLVGAKGAGHLE